MSSSGWHRILQFSGLMGISHGNFDPTRFAEVARKDPHSESDDIRLGLWRIGPVIASPGRVARPLRASPPSKRPP
jgi:hypothetical protein